jgi:hypothetical protein
LGDKHLPDVCKALKIKGFSATEKPLKSHWKATEKPPKRLPKNTEPLKIKHFVKFFSVFQFAEKDPLPSPTDPTPPDPYQNPVFFYTFQLYWKTEKKSSRSLKIKVLRFFGNLFGSFSVAFRFLALLQKTCYNKAPTLPPPLAQHHHKTVENQALHDAN